MRESRADNERRGFKVHGVYWTMGQYDLVATHYAHPALPQLGPAFPFANAGNMPAAIQA